MIGLKSCEHKKRMQISVILTMYIKKDTVTLQFFYGFIWVDPCCVSVNVVCCESVYM